MANDHELSNTEGNEDAEGDNNNFDKKEKGDLYNHNQTTNEMSDIAVKG